MKTLNFLSLAKIKKLLVFLLAVATLAGGIALTADYDNAKAADANDQQRGDGMRGGPGGDFRGGDGFRGRMDNDFRSGFRDGDRFRDGRDFRFRFRDRDDRFFRDGRFRQRRFFFRRHRFPFFSGSTIFFNPLFFSYYPNFYDICFVGDDFNEDNPWCVNTVLRAWNKGWLNTTGGF